MNDLCELPKPNQRDSKKWARAKSFEELCELTAQFTEGKIGYFPGWFSSKLYEETNPLRKKLAAINRKGFLTYMSQPGKSIRRKTGIGQRAFLTGLMPTLRTPWFLGELEKSSLYVAVYECNLSFASRFAVASMRSPRTIVTLPVDGEEGFYVGDDRYELLTGFERCLPECGNAMIQVGEADFVVIVDHQWGRNTLWSEVTKAIDRTPPANEIDQMLKEPRAEELAAADGQKRAV